MIVAVIQARCDSRRLQGKVLAPLAGRPLLVRQIERVRRARRLDRVVVATSDTPADDALVETLALHEPAVAVYRGDLHDVLDRVYRAAAAAGAEHVVRLTGDCPLTDPEVIDLIVGEHQRRRVDYTSNSLRRTFPDGLDVEVIRMAALAEARRQATEAADREHVTRFLCCRPERFALHSVELDEDLSALRWVVDHPVDLQVVSAVFERLLPDNPEFGMRDVLALQRAAPELFAANAHLPCTEDWQAILRREATGGD